MAVEMQKLCATLRAPDGSPVVMRIGLHCGPVVGGIVGGNMIRYHLFGSTLDAVIQVSRTGAATGLPLMIGLILVHLLRGVPYLIYFPLTPPAGAGVQPRQRAVLRVLCDGPEARRCVLTST